MLREIRTAWWSVAIPDTWIGTHHAECVTLEAIKPVGALQISGHTKDSEVSDDDLRDFADEHLKAGARPVPANFGNYSGFSIAYGRDGFFWQEWYLRRGRHMVFATYNCAESSRGKEDSAVNEILSSLSPIDEVA